MYGFLFRKTVFDVWDHVIGFFLMNLGYVALFALEFLWWHLNSTEALSFAAAGLLMLLTLLAISAYTMLVNVFAHNVLNGAAKGQTLRGAGAFLKTHIGQILLHALIVMIVFVNAVFAIPFYMRMGGFAGPMFAFVALFLSLFLIIHFKYYLPLCRVNPEAGVLDVIKYSFAYALDNKGVTAVLMLRTLLDVAVSVPFFGVFPGFTGILVSDTCAAMLLNKRYVMAEEQEKEDKTLIPWDPVLETMNKKRYMNRRFVSLLFPGR